MKHLAKEAAEQLQDCYDYHKAGPNFDLQRGEQIVEQAIQAAVAAAVAERDEEIRRLREALESEIQPIEEQCYRLDGEQGERPIADSVADQIQTSLSAIRSRLIAALQPTNKSKL